MCALFTIIYYYFTIIFLLFSYYFYYYFTIILNCNYYFTIIFLLFFYYLLLFLTNFKIIVNNSFQIEHDCQNQLFHQLDPQETNLLCPADRKCPRKGSCRPCWCWNYSSLLAIMHFKATASDSRPEDGKGCLTTCGQWDGPKTCIQVWQQV